MNDFVYVLILVFAATFNAILAVYLYWFGYRIPSNRHRSAKYLAIVNLCVSTWVTAFTIYRFTEFWQQGYLWFNYPVALLIWIPAVLIPYFLIRFTLTLYNPNLDIRRYHFLKFPLFLVLAATIIPGISMLDFTTTNLSPRFGSFPSWIYIIYMFSYTGMLTVLLARKFHNQTGQKKTIVGILLLFLSLSLFSGLTTNIIASLLQLNVEDYITPMFSLISGFMIMYLIVRYQIFDIPRDSSWILVLITSTMILLLTRIGLSIGTFNTEQELDYIVVGIFVFLYAFLLRELYQNTKRKDVMAKTKAKLDSVVQAKNEFLRKSSHQLRTPLTVIIGFLADMIDENSDHYQMTEQGHQDLTKSYMSARNLNYIINDLLAANDINAGKFGINIHETIDLQEFINNILTEKDSVLKEKNTNIDFHVYGEDFQVYVDPSKLKEALNNIIDNAIFYGKGQVDITLDGQKTEFIIQVADNGVGIKPEEMENIWNKFERGKNSAKINPNGSGLGLYLARMIMQKHGGTLIGDSEGHNKGSIFTFHLPRDVKNKAPSESFGPDMGKNALDTE